MITCPKCNKELTDDAMFCDECGASLTEEATEEIVVEEVAEEIEEPVASEEPQVESISKVSSLVKGIKLPKLPFALDKKLVKSGAIAVAAVLVVVLLLSTILGSAGKQNYTFYIKDSEVFYTSISKIKPWQVTDNLVDGDGVDNSDLRYLALYYSYLFQVSEDGKTVFFVDKIGDSDGFSLYYRAINKAKKEAVKISGEVESYQLNEKSNIVTYKKNDNLYQYDMKESEKVANDVTSYYVSDDGKMMVYLDDEDRAYFKKAGKDKEKIDSDVEYIEHVTEDRQTVYYIKDDNLYMKSYGKDKEKIASDVYNVIKVYESGEMYYLKDASEEVSLLDYVTDDKKDEDAAMKEPEYPKRADYDSADEYDKAYDEYREARQEYWDKEDRDELREDLKEEELDLDCYELFYFNGKKSESVAKNVDNYDVEVAADKPVVAYAAYGEGDVEKVKLSEIDYIWEVEDLVEDAMEEGKAWSVAVKTKTSAISEEDADYFNISNDGKELYFLADISDENGHGDLYRAKVSGSKVKKAEKYDTDVYAESYAVSYIGDDITYYKDVDDDGETGILYIGKKKVSEDVKVNSDRYYEDQEVVMFMTDYDEDDNCGVLNQYNGSKSVKIADDVYSYHITAKGDIIYLSDYSTEKYRGDLYLYKKNKPKKIDEDVVAIIPV